MFCECLYKIKNGNVTDINCTSKTQKFCGNLMEILKEMFNGDGTRNNCPEIQLNGNKYENYVIKRIVDKST